MKVISLLFLFCSSLLGQFSFGLIAGVPLTNLINDSPTPFAPSGSVTTADKSGRYTVGPTVQVSLPLGFRLEADALYRPAAFSLSSSSSSTTFLLANPSLSSAQWRFPVLLQYRLSFPVFNPYLEAGYSYDHVNLGVSLPNGLPSGPTASGPGALSITSNHGFVIGAGFDIKVPFVRISPEIRYTRDLSAGGVLNANQAEFLVGVRF